MQGAFFPVQLDNMGAEMIFFQPNLNKYKLRGTVSSALRHNHPGGAFTYKFERKGKSFAFCTDIEHGKEIDQNIVDFCQGVDVLIHDAQFTEEELERKRGWGHSSYDQAIQVAEMTGAKQLIMTHHDPDHDDEFLNRIEKRCQDRFKDCVLAREGMEIQV
jgi:ribonuclease BN (tRNA processing enzyme)